MLHELARHKSVLEAAKNFAGNWLRWASFVWFGSSRCPNSKNVAIVYLTDHIEGSVESNAKGEYIIRELDSFKGKLESGALVEDYSATFHGDKDAFGGVIVRVYDDAGQITEPFRKLYDLAVRAETERYLDKETYFKLGKAQLLTMVKDVLADRESDLDAETVTEEMYRGDSDFDFDLVEYGQIEEFVSNWSA